MLASTFTELPGHPVAPGRTEILVYYANETDLLPARAENEAIVIDWLRAEGSDRARRIADQLADDRTAFPAAVASDIEAIRAAGLHAIAFTNRLAQQARYLALEGHTAHALPWLQPAFADYVLQSSPMASTTTLRAALRLVAQRFDPQQHNFVLVLKSHGNEDFAATPRLVVHHETTGRDGLLKLALLPDASADLQHLLPSPRPGITKSELLNAIAQTGRDDGMQFSLVVV